MSSNKHEKNLSNQRTIEILLITMVFTAAIVLLFDVIPYEFSMIKTIACESLIFVLLVSPSLMAYRFQNGSMKLRGEFDAGEIKTIVILVFFRVVLAFFLQWLNIAMIGMSNIWNPIMLFVYLVYYIFIVAVCEEFIFRIYVQETFEKLLGRLKICAPVISGVLFGCFHLITGDMTSAFISTILGVIWGYVRYAGVSFTSMVLIHGLSNYSLYILAIMNGLIYGA